MVCLIGGIRPYIDVEVLHQEQLDPLLVVGRVPVELVGALVPFDLVQAGPLQVVVAGEVHVVARLGHFWDVQDVDLQGHHAVDWKATAKASMNSRRDPIAIKVEHKFA